MFSVLSLSQVWYQYLRIGLQCRRPWFNSWVRKIHCRRDRPPTPVFLGFLRGLAGKESACNMGHWGSIPGLGRSPREGNDYPLQYSGLENSWQATVPGITESDMTNTHQVMLISAQIWATLFGKIWGEKTLLFEIYWTSHKRYISKKWHLGSVLPSTYIKFRTDTRTVF